MGILMDITVYISGDKIGMFYALGSMATSFQKVRLDP